MAIEKPMRIPVNGTWEEFNPQTSLNMIKDMSTFMRLLNVAADATAARNQLGVKELTPPNLLDALHSYGDNYVPADTSNAGWNAMGFSVTTFTELNKFKQQPGQWGMLLNLPSNKTGSESFQIWISMPDGKMYTRGANASYALDDTPFSLISGQGFVAQSLQQNGWVKAANGLIIQWGISGSYGNVDAVMNVTYPVAFSWFGIPIGVVFSGMRDTDGSGGDNIQSYSNSGFVYSHGANSRPSSVLYMAIGI